MEEQKKKKLKVWQIVLIVIGGLFILGIFSSLIKNNDNSSLDNELNSFGNIDSYSNEKLIILNHKQTYSDYGNLIISGSAKNTAGRELGYCSIDVKFYDFDNAVIGTSLDNINDLGEDETWKFEVYYLGTDTENVNSYKIEVGSCW